MKHLLVLPAALALAAGLSACSGGGVPERQAATRLPPTSPTVTTAPPSTTTGPPATPAATASATAAPSSSANPSASAAPSFPPDVEDREQGGTYAAVYLAVTRGGQADASNERADDQAEQAGYDAQDADVDCDRGAREGLRLARGTDYVVTRLFFATAAQARQFVQAYEPGVVGTVTVRSFCND